MRPLLRYSRACGVGGFDTGESPEGRAGRKDAGQLAGLSSATSCMVSAFARIWRSGQTRCHASVSVSTTGSTSSPGRTQQTEPEAGST
jgi:hypothetical protein